MTARLKQFFVRGETVMFVTVVMDRSVSVIVEW